MRGMDSLLFAGTILALSAAGAAADQIGYAVDTAENLYSVNVTTATAALIGNTGNFLEGLALSPGDALFGTDSGGNLFSINKTTGSAALIGDTALDDIEGLDFNGTTLLGTNFSNPTTVYEINTTTAAVNPITSFAQGVVRAMAVQNPSTIFVSSDTPNFQTLVSVNLVGGADTPLGLLPSTAIIAALDFGTDGNLYALDGAGNDYIINQANGSGLLVGNTGGQFWLDLTLGVPSVPEPSSMVLLVTAALGFIGFRTRRG